jgi:hypothetical protein
MRLATSLANGRWLGRFSELTLIKGPGYPLFLAINSWLGIPISLAHAAFYCLALLALSLVILKASKSYILAFLVLFIPLWHPKLFEVGRVVRDMIYASQAILFVALFSYCMLMADLRSKTRWAFASGAILAWFWLTREEGVWILPAVALTIAYAFLHHKELPLWESTLKPTLLMLIAFGAVQGAFCFGNWIAYGSFSGVDVKEKNFQAAMSAMESVQVGERKAYVSVPQAVRGKIYEISPAFAELKNILDPEGTLSQWQAGGCMYHKETCGDISTGFYMWALREAAGKAGHYASPQMAAAFFGGIAADIKNACADGRLSCRSKPLPYMPPVTDEQVAAIPRTIAELIETVAIPIRPNALPWDIFGTRKDFEATLRFLNYPQHFPLDSDAAVKITLVGWYYDREAPDGWFQVRVVDRNGTELPHVLTRNDSIDLTTTFENEKAGHQRFSLTTTCGPGCTLLFTTGHGKEQEFVIGSKVKMARNYFALGSGTLAFDSADIPINNASADKRRRAINHLLPLLYTVYKYFTPVLLGIGIIACIYAFCLALSRRVYPVILCIAGACWAAIIARAAILILLDISSFPGVTTIYMYPIFSMSAIAACLSIAAAYSLLRDRTQAR